MRLFYADKKYDFILLFLSFLTNLKLLHKE
jgi:hypothetical protein